jgi:sarcosine oxidase, subunit alpha
MTPYDMGLDWAVGKKKADFVGKRSLSRPDIGKPDRKQFVGLLTENPNDVLEEGAQIVLDPSAPVPVPMVGHVTSSYPSATLGRSIALAVIAGGRGRIGETVSIPMPDRVIRAKVTEPMFYDAEGSRLNV